MAEASLSLKLCYAMPYGNCRRTGDLRPTSFAANYCSKYIQRG